MSEVEYTFAYLPPDPNMIALFAREYPWAKQFVRLAPAEKKQILLADATGATKKQSLEFEDVVIALGDLYLSDGGQPTIVYEIVALPKHLMDHFNDVVDGKGDLFKRLKKVIDFSLSCFINAIFAEVEENGVREEDISNNESQPFQEVTEEAAQDTCEGKIIL